MGDNENKEIAAPELDRNITENTYSMEIIDQYLSDEEMARNSKTAVVIICIFAALSALTAALPPTEPFSKVTNPIDTGDTAFVIISAAMVLLMTPGVAFFYGGAVGHKNIVSTMYQSYIALGLVSILWVIVGFSLAFGKDANGSGIMGYPATYYMFNNVGANPDPALAGTIPVSIFSMFQLMFAVITPTLISGSLAERINFNAWMLFICIWHLVVYCPLVHMVWHPDGVLRKWGYIDFAGGIPIEMASGYAALAGSIYLGPRTSPTHAPANIPYIMLGTAIFWFGWLGFNAGSALSAGSLACQTFVTTNTAGAASMMTWVLLELLLGMPISAVGACNGIVVGLVAITPACGYVTAGGAMCIAFIATIICFSVGKAMKILSGIDDSLDVFAVHGVGGTCGVILTAVFCSLDVNPAGHNGLVYGHGMQLAKHIAIILVAIPMIMVSSYGCFWITDSIIPIRVSAEIEEMGLDISLHRESVHSGGGSIPDGSMHDSIHGATARQRMSITAGSIDIKAIYNEDNL